MTVINKRALKSFINKIETAKKKIAIQRDILRDLTDEVSQIVEDCQEAEYDLDHAADSLSRWL